MTPRNSKISTDLQYKKIPELSKHKINPIDPDKIYYNIFVFYLEPINKDIKLDPIHFELHTSESAPSFIHTLVQSISDALLLLNIFVEYVAPDGDHQHDCLHYEFFDKYITKFEKGASFQGIVKQAIENSTSREKKIPISDFLHSAKIIRGNIVNNHILLEKLSKFH